MEAWTENTGNRRIIGAAPAIISLAAVMAVSTYGWLVGGILTGVIIALVVVIIYPGIIFPVTIVILSSTTQLTVELRQAVTIGFTFLIIFYWLWQKLSEDSPFHKLDTFVFSYMVFTVSWLMLSTLMSPHVALGAFVTVRKAIFFVLVYIFFDWIRSEKEIWLLFKTYLILGIVLGVFTFVEFFKGGFQIISIGTFVIPVRYTIPGTNPNSLGMNLLYVIPVITGMFLYRKNDSKRFLLFIILILTLLALFLTFARSSWLGVAFAFMVLLLTRKTGRRVIVFSLISFALAILFSEPLRDLLSILIRLEQGVTHRDIIWKAAWQIFKENPIFGSGPWTFRFHLFSYARVEPGSWISDVISGITGAHNLYLTKLAELGVGGIVITVGLYVLFLMKLRTGFKYATRQEHRNILFICAAIWAGSFARSFFEVNGTIYFWTILLITMKIGEIAKEEFQREKSKELVPDA